MRSKRSRFRVHSVEPLERRRLLSATLTTLLNFTGAAGSLNFNDVTSDAAGNLYGNMAGSVVELSGPAHTTFTTLAAIGANALDFDAEGNLFGTTASSPNGSPGIVFELSGSNHTTLTTLVTFNRADGLSASGGLVFDSAGNLYGTTVGGGTSNFGTVFELSSPTYSTVNTLANFNGTNGNQPKGLVFDANGNLFGTTILGGDSSLDSGNGGGTVFELAGPSHTTLNTLAIFNGTDGAEPNGLSIDSHGNLFGTTSVGGQLSLNSGNGVGTVFEVAGPNHATISTLWVFDSATDGGTPNFGLLLDGAGDLFGTTGYGGILGSGTLFEVSASDLTTLNTLVMFNGADGAHPKGLLTADGAGNVYGTTSTSNAGLDGSVFELTGAGFVPPTPTTTFATLSNGALTVTGTASADAISLQTDGSGNLTATLNAVTSSPIALSSITSIDVEAGAGNDVITLGAGVPGASVQGGPGDDSITGGPGNDTLGGGAGNDTVLGSAGNDSIKGGAGNDSLGGGQGNDYMLGSLGNDTLTGGAGNDTLNGGAGNNVVHGGLGDDTIFAINNLADTLYGGAGNDTAHIDQGLDQLPNNDIETILFT